MAAKAAAPAGKPAAKAASGKGAAKPAAKPPAKPGGKGGGKVVPSHDPDYEYYEEEEEEEEMPPQKARPVAPVRGSQRPVPAGTTAKPAAKPAPVPVKPQPAPPPVDDEDIDVQRTSQATSFSPRPTGSFAGTGGGAAGVRPTQPPRPPVRELAAPVAGGDKVPPELTKLFSLVGKFQPQPLELQPHFKPFLPDLQVAIGNIDAFIKVPRPDGETDLLGLKVLDEPTIGSANPQILKMQLREKFGVVGGNESDGFIGAIDVGANLQKSLTNFLESYDEISRNRAAPAMVYSSKMPEIGDLMEPWTAELQEAVESCQLPDADLEMTLEEYARFVCAMLDIPVRGNIVESCHVLFSLLQRFKEISYFGTQQSREGSLTLRGS